MKLMSYASPQVQDYVLSYFDELLDYEARGHLPGVQPSPAADDLR